METMKKRNLISLMLGFFVSVFILTACGSDDDNDYNNEHEKEDYEVAVSSIYLDEWYLSMYEGEGTFIAATVYPSNATNKDLQWFSHNPTIAKVTNGYVEAISKGETTITVTTEDGRVQESLPVRVRNIYDDVYFSFSGASYGGYPIVNIALHISCHNKTGETITITDVSVTDESTKESIFIDKSFLPLQINSTSLWDWETLWFQFKISASVKYKFGVVVTFVFHGKEYSCEKFYIELP